MTAILILAADKKGTARINTEKFNKSKIKPKNKCPSVKILNNPCNPCNPWQKNQNEDCCHDMELQSPEVRDLEEESVVGLLEPLRRYIFSNVIVPVNLFQY
jgi:hypothetical protein